MKNRNSFTNSDLGRSKPRRRVLHSFINDKLKRHRSDTGLVEDRTSSTAIVRIIIGLLLLHLVIIGGVLLRGHLEKGGHDMTSPLAAPPEVAQEDSVLPAPTAKSPAPSAAATVTRITPGVVDEDTAEDAALFPDAPATAQAQGATANTPAAPAVTPTPTPAPAALPAGMTMVKHHVATGESWISIARKYGTTHQALMAANPGVGTESNLPAGVYLQVPVKKDSAQVRRAQADQPVAAAPKVHILKQDETLGVVARKYRTTVEKLQELNNLKKSDLTRLRVGRKIIISK